MLLNSWNSTRTDRTVKCSFEAQSAADELLLTAIREAFLTADDVKFSIAIQMPDRVFTWVNPPTIKPASGGESKEDE
jgi:hypothetical protein